MGTEIEKNVVAVVVVVDQDRARETKKRSRLLETGRENRLPEIGESPSQLQERRKRKRISPKRKSQRNQRRRQQSRPTPRLKSQQLLGNHHSRLRRRRQHLLT